MKPSRIFLPTYPVAVILAIPLKFLNDRQVISRARYPPIKRRITSSPINNGRPTATGCAPPNGLSKTDCYPSSIVSRPDKSPGEEERKGTSYESCDIYSNKLDAVVADTAQADSGPHSK
jgi:hypothetical protein